MASTRTLYLPGLLRNNYEGIGPNTITSQNGSSGYLHHGSQFTVTGSQAIYLKNTYVSSPALPTDVLQVISISG